MQAKRFETLDGLRGVAALMVFGGHAATIMGINGLVFSHAVDLFFLLSGFVIGHAYEAKLQSGLSFPRFMTIRLIRLYPLYIAGVSISLIVPIATVLTTGQLWPLGEPARMLGWAVFLLPRPEWGPERSFLLNPPAWSLFLEVAVNIAYAVALPWLSRKALIGVLIASALGLAFAVWHFGTTNFGTGGVQMLVATFKIACPFTIGLLIYRVWASGKLPAWRLPAVLPLAMFLAFSALLSWRTTPWAEYLVVVLINPAIVIVGIGVQPSGLLARLSKWSGDLSYPLYILHIPLLILPTHFASAAWPVNWWYPAIVVPAVLFIASAAIKPDERVRAALTGIVRRREKRAQRSFEVMPNGAAL